MIVAYKPLGWHKAWRGAIASGFSYDDMDRKYELKFDRQDAKEQLHVVMNPTEAWSIIHAGIMRMIENGHIDMIKGYIKDGLESKKELDDERRKLTEVEQ